MSLNPLNELKRRLDDDSTPLPKRLCLAKNVVQSHYFPSAPKERIVADWLLILMQRNKLSGEELRDLLKWLNSVDHLTNELKGKSIQIVAEYIQSNPLQENDMQCVLSFIENDKIQMELLLHLNEYLIITKTLLQCLKVDDTVNNVPLVHKILNNMINCYKASKKKLEFIVKLLDGENLETLFSFLNTECHTFVIDVLQTILFPVSKKSFFINLLQTMVRKDSIDELIAEKGDNIQSVIKIMNTFYTFPEGRSSNNQIFLSNFIDVFVSCFRHESQLIFAFYIMVADSLEMEQDYLSPAMKMPPINFDQNNKIKRSIFLKMLDILLVNEVDISVRLTDTFGEKISKVEIKKNFTAFLQALMMGQLKLEGKVDKNTLLIITTALKIDPILIDQKINLILPTIMTSKKNSINVMEAYKDMLNCLLNIFFKLSRGTQFLSQVLPLIKESLETHNNEQVDLKEKVKQLIESGNDVEKVNSKMITMKDIFPQESVDLYGKLTSELMFRQNTELLASLQKDFENYCLVMLEEGIISPSVIILTEILSAIMCSYFENNKMADHTVPLQVAENFWSVLQSFEADCLKKLGECVIRFHFNPELMLSFLKLCLSYSRLKILNINYGNIKMDMPVTMDVKEIFNLTVLLPYLDSDQWTNIASNVTEYEAALVLDQLLLLKIMAVEILSNRKPVNNKIEEIIETKSFLIKQLGMKSEILASNEYYSSILFQNLEASQTKQLAKIIVKLYLNNLNQNIFSSDALNNNRTLLNTLILETSKGIMENFENTERLCKTLKKTNFDFNNFLKEIDSSNFFDQITFKENISENLILNYVEILNRLKIYYAAEMYQLVAIYVLLAVKKCSNSKKNKRAIDNLLQNIFELSPRYPDIFKIFPVNFLFSFEDKSLLNLLHLKIKSSNQTLVIKKVLECAVKKVKTENEIVKNIVNILLSKQTEIKNTKLSIEYFNDRIFQISCTILPIIAKEKRAITASAYRSILADLQEKMHNAMLDSLKNIDFSSNTSLFSDGTGDADDNVLESENTLATLNAIEAYSLTLSKYCESQSTDEIKKLESLWSGLEFFVSNAINTIKKPNSKNQHVHPSIQLLNVLLRHIKKLESHQILQKKDELFLKIWRCITHRLQMIFDKKNGTEKNDAHFIEDIAVTLKLLCELSSVDAFVTNFVSDLSNLVSMKDLSQNLNEESSNVSLTNFKVSRYLWTNCLKANIVGPKCAALTKLMSAICRKIQNWIQQHFEYNQSSISKCDDNSSQNIDIDSIEVKETVRVLKVEDSLLEMIKINMDTLSEVILSGKKISLDYKFLDAIFELQHMVQIILGCNAVDIKCATSWQGFFTLYGGSFKVLNSLLMARQEILEDRWPCFMQCYRALIFCLCQRATSQSQLERPMQDKLAEIAHNMEKLTQTLCKKKTQISRLAAYTVADICAGLESTAPSKMVRQHLENCVAYLIQASDSTYAMAFLKRALAGCVGQSTMTNLYNMYKRYHKYVGNS